MFMELYDNARPFMEEWYGHWPNTTIVTTAFRIPTGDNVARNRHHRNRFVDRRDPPDWAGEEEESLDGSDSSKR